MFDIKKNMTAGRTRSIEPGEFVRLSEDTRAEGYTYREGRVVLIVKADPDSKVLTVLCDDDVTKDIYSSKVTPIDYSNLDTKLIISILKRIVDYASYASVQLRDQIKAIDDMIISTRNPEIRRSLVASKSTLLDKRDMIDTRLKEVITQIDIRSLI